MRRCSSRKLLSTFAGGRDHDEPIAWWRCQRVQQFHGEAKERLEEFETSLIHFLSTTLSYHFISDYHELTRGDDRENKV
jgi:hypothetical protein